MEGQACDHPSLPLFWTPRTFHATPVPNMDEDTLHQAIIQHVLLYLSDVGMEWVEEVTGENIIEQLMGELGEDDAPQNDDVVLALRQSGGGDRKDEEEQKSQEQESTMTVKGHNTMLQDHAMQLPREVTMFKVEQWNWGYCCLVLHGMRNPCCFPCHWIHCCHCPSCGWLLPYLSCHCHPCCWWCSSHCCHDVIVVVVVAAAVVTEFVIVFCCCCYCCCCCCCCCCCHYDCHCSSLCCCRPSSK